MIVDAAFESKNWFACLSLDSDRRWQPFDNFVEMCIQRGPYRIFFLRTELDCGLFLQHFPRAPSFCLVYTHSIQQSSAITLSKKGENYLDLSSEQNFSDLYQFNQPELISVFDGCALKEKSKMPVPAEPPIGMTSSGSLLGFSSMESMFFFVLDKSLYGETSSLAGKTLVTFPLQYPLSIYTSIITFLSRAATIGGFHVLLLTPFLEPLFAMNKVVTLDDYDVSLLPQSKNGEVSSPIKSQGVQAKSELLFYNQTPHPNYLLGFERMIAMLRTAKLSDKVLLPFPDAENKWQYEKKNRGSHYEIELYHAVLEENAELFHPIPASLNCLSDDEVFSMVSMAKTTIFYGATYPQSRVLRYALLLNKNILFYDRSPIRLSRKLMNSGRVLLFNDSNFAKMLDLSRQKNSAQDVIHSVETYREAMISKLSAYCEEPIIALPNTKLI